MIVTEQDKTLEGLKVAIQMEIDGKEYYLKISKKSNTESGKKLLTSLSVEEDSHRQKFEKIYDAIQKKKGWPITSYKSHGGEGFRTIFAGTIEKTGFKIKNDNTELSAVKIAMDMENKTYDFYKNQSEDANYDAERRFYEAVAAEEKGHYLALLDYYEYLQDPEGWFAKEEHSSLDGG